MSTTINGKKPLSTKSTGQSHASFDELFGNALALSDAIKSTLAKEGYSYRFINYTKLVNMGGHHERYWEPVTRKQLKEWGCAMMDSHSFILGSDPDGLIRRGDLCLAIRPIDLNDKHKAWLRERASAQSNVQRTHAERLRKSAVAGVTIREGYEDDK